MNTVKHSKHMTVWSDTIELVWFEYQESRKQGYKGLWREFFKEFIDNAVRFKTGNILSTVGTIEKYNDENIDSCNFKSNGI